MSLKPFIQNCGPRFQFKCPLVWDSLRITEDPEIRFCEVCSQNVYFCLTIEKAKARARDGQCVALLATTDRSLTAQQHTSERFSLNQIDERVRQIIPKEIAQKYTLMPVRWEGTTLTVACDGPLSVYARDDLIFLTGLNIEETYAPSDEIRAAIEKQLSDSRCDMGIMLDDEDYEPEPDSSLSPNDATVVRLVNIIFEQAIKQGVSKIICEDNNAVFRVSFETGPNVVEQMQPSRKLWSAVIARFHQLAEARSDFSNEPATIELSISLKQSAMFRLALDDGQKPTKATLTRINDSRWALNG